MKSNYQIMMMLLLISILIICTLSYNVFIIVDENLKLKNKIELIKKSNDDVIKLAEKMDSLQTELFILNSQVGRYEFTNEMFFQNKPDNLYIEYQEILNNETE